jgi:hypothetical protein
LKTEKLSGPGNTNEEELLLLLERSVELSQLSDVLRSQSAAIVSQSLCLLRRSHLQSAGLSELASTFNDFSTLLPASFD